MVASQGSHGQRRGELVFNELRVSVRSEQQYSHWLFCSSLCSIMFHIIVSLLPGFNVSLLLYNLL